MKFRTGYAALLACGALSLAVSTFCAQGPDTDNERDIAPNGKGIGTQYVPGERGDHFGPSRLSKTPGAATGTNGIFYHGGPLILGTTNVYYIWYGNWSGNTATTILKDLVSSIGGSPYFNINSTYTDGSGTHVTNSVHYVNSTTDSYSHGTSLSDSAIQAIVASAITSNRLPLDTNGVYFVLTSADVNETSGFCTKYCGWHTYGTISGTNIKYAFIGNGDRCPSACEEQTTSSPNGNTGADGMASVISHELEEAVTDPDLNAWYDRRGQENADKCAWTFGTTYTVSNGSLANMKLGTRDYLIQRNWVNLNGGYCALKYP
jgi:Phosphate-induced protein 1 conserved region